MGYSAQSRAMRVERRTVNKEQQEHEPIESQCIVQAMNRSL